MDPTPLTPQSGQLFGYPLREHLKLSHALNQLADLIDWDRIIAVCSEGFTSGRGRPATFPRLIAGLLYLQHAFDLSDEDVVWGWVENPYLSDGERSALKPIQAESSTSIGSIVLYGMRRSLRCKTVLLKQSSGFGTCRDLQFHTI